MGSPLNYYGVYQNCKVSGSSIACTAIPERDRRGHARAPRVLRRDRGSRVRTVAPAMPTPRATTRTRRRTVAHSSTTRRATTTRSSARCRQRLHLRPDLLRDELRTRRRSPGRRRPLAQHDQPQHRRPRVDVLPAVRHGRDGVHDEGRHARRDLGQHVRERIPGGQERRLCQTAVSGGAAQTILQRRHGAAPQRRRQRGRLQGRRHLNAALGGYWHNKWWPIASNVPAGTYRLK